MRLLVCALLLVSIGAARGGAMAAGQGQPTFRASAHLIVQTVVVKDGEGRPIEGLTAKDFVVTENGAPQPIAFVDYQTMSADALPPFEGGPVVNVDVSAAPALPGLTRSSIRVPPAGDTRYQNRRLIVLYFDILNMGFFDELRMYDHAARFITSRMTAADLVAVMLFEESSVSVLQDFTDDRAKLLELVHGLGAAADDRRTGAGGSVETGSAFGQDNEVFNIFSTDRQLAALQTAVTDLGPLPQLKTLVYLGSGLRLQGTDNVAQMRATVNAAVRSNVTINPIDTRGLVAAAPMGDARQPSRGGVGMFNGMIAQSLTTRAQRSQDAYYALAKDTGGRATFDNNDLSAGIQEAAGAVMGYYILGYYSSSTDRDGRFRRVKVELAGDRRAALSYRAGYFGEKDFSRFNRADKERQLEDALKLEDPITDVPIAIEINYFQLNAAEYFVPVSVRMPAADIAPQRANGSIDAEIDVVAEIKDEYGVTHRNVRDRVAFRLDSAAAREVVDRTIQYELGFTVLPGKYVIKLLAREATGGRIGTFETSFEVPNLERVTRELPISTVVLSSQRQPYADALETVKQRIPGDTANPLVVNGQRLIPSVSRVFRAAGPMYVFLQAYQRGEDALQPLVAYVTFYRGEASVMETAPVSVAAERATGTRAVPIRIDVPLAGLAPGPYECQVTVLDAAGKRAAFWRALVTIRR